MIDTAGTLTARATVEYPILTIQPGWAAQDPQVWAAMAMAPPGQAVMEAGIAAMSIGARLVQADIFNRLIYRTKTVEAAAAGAALLIMCSDLT